MALQSSAPFTYKRAPPIEEILIHVVNFEPMLLLRYKPWIQAQSYSWAQLHLNLNRAFICSQQTHPSSPHVSPHSFRECPGHSGPVRLTVQFLQLLNCCGLWNGVEMGIEDESYFQFCSTHPPDDQNRLIWAQSH